MTSLDDWITRAADVTRVPPSRAALARLEQRLDAEPSPRAFQARRDNRGIVFGVALATVLSFSGSGWLLSKAPWADPPPPTWVSAPPASSPYGLLVER